MMFESSMAEDEQSELSITTDKPHLVSTVIDWIYSSEIDFPENTKDIFELILMADEYLLEDLRRKCEDVLLYRLDETNALEILVAAFRYNTIVSENLIEYCISTLIEDFDYIQGKEAKMEELLTSTPCSHRRAWTHHSGPTLRAPAQA